MKTVQISKGLSEYKNYFDVGKLVKKIKTYLPDFDEDKFLMAFEFSERAHKGQMRKDGSTPYFVHPVKVVEILVTIHADEDVLISALLHDVPEDTKYDIQDVREKFGDTVAFLVDGITKLSKVHYKNNMPEREVESLKKLFLHTTKDPRVILIKLADRLHNMRTLENIENDEKRIRIARETLEIYVPIANLLGIQELKFELEDLCFKHLFPSEYEQLKQKIDELKRKHRLVANKFIEEVRKILETNNIKAEIYERNKNLYSIYKKLCEEGKTLDSVKDRIAIRIIVDKISECYQVLGVLHCKYTPQNNRFRDYIANPKSNGYQSLHTRVFGPNGKETDIQIRTQQMHSDAEYGIVSHFFNRSLTQLSEDKRSSWLNKIIELEKEGKAHDDFLENLKVDVFQDRIVVFTPKGENVDLPVGATAIDFAYAIHTDLGDHIDKVEVDGDLCSPTQPLQTGNTVNVIPSENATPQLYWLSFAKTNLAKQRIRAYLKKESREKKIHQGRKILQKELDIASLGLVDNISFKKLKREIFEKIGKSFAQISDMLIAIGEGEIKAVDIVKLITRPSRRGLFFRSRPGGVRVNAKIVARNRFGLLRDISDICYKYSSDMTYLKGWSSKDRQDAYFTVQILVNDISAVSKIFEELEQLDEVMHVYRISSKGIFLTYVLSISIATFWIVHPLLLARVQDSWNVYLGLFFLLGTVLYLNQVIKRYFPIVRNKTALWIFAFSLPAVSVLTLLVEVVYFDLTLSWLAIMIEMIIIYGYLALSFYNLRKVS